ncbi:MAG TPA: TetR/AcrR family transcriptional regulator [Quisquiliibacterium sp.]|nr:TetR/AcrR family transcriptional regulator [Quisquiliibacterium sp.]
MPATPRKVAGSRETVPRRPRRPAPLRVVQPRAQATLDALLSAGHRLLQSRALDEISIAEIAAESGVSVGSFYGRFSDKESYFAVLQERVTRGWLEEGRVILDRACDEAPAAADLVHAICAAYIGIFRRERGFVRAALKHASSHPGSWTPFRSSGQAFVAEALARLEPLLGHLPQPQRAPRIRFAMQLMFAAGVNAVLNDPGPIRLDDPGLEAELARALCAYLEIPWTPAS